MSALTTHSKFYYGIEIEETSKYLDFDEGGGELTATLDVKVYSLEEIRAAVEAALNEAGALTYTVSMDRETRKMTINASASVDLLASSGSNAGFGAWSVIGFNPADVLSTTSAEGDSAIGSEYTPQFILQNYVPKEKNRRLLNSTVSRSASGANVTVQSFGEERFIKFNIQYITDIEQPPGQRLRSSHTGVDDALAFLEFITRKEHFEFMPDENDPDTFTTVLIESLANDRDGTSFELKEYYDRGLPFYFETGLIVLKALD